LKEVPAEDFPNTTSILPATMNLQQGLIISTSGDATSNMIHQRIIDIQNLSGNTISLALWHDMAVNFNLQEYEVLERPVVIAVSSCWGVRFTSEATIYKINTQKKWYYQRCASCGKQVHPGNPFPTCPNHGPQPTPVYSYCFKAIINDGTATMSMTCFSDQANALIRDCNDILAELPNKNPYELPSALTNLEGTTHVFQFHFDSGSTSRRRDLVLDKVLETAVLPLPAPPPQVVPPEAIVQEQPKVTQLHAFRLVLEQPQKLSRWLSHSSPRNKSEHPASSVSDGVVDDVDVGTVAFVVVETVAFDVAG
ncbi:DNA helicase, partial [Tanacetum coccineum]